MALAHQRFEVFSANCTRAEGPRPRAAIRVAKNLAAAQLVQFTSRDQVACNIKGRDHDFVMASIYCDINKPAVTRQMTALVQHCQNKAAPLIMGLDSNSHSTLWGPTQNTRGSELEDFINANGLVVLNDGQRPTWSQGERVSYIDITVINRYAAEKFYGENWEVQEGESFSDHKLITFDIIPPLLTPRATRNMKNFDWHRFRVSVDRELEGVDSGSQIDFKTSELIRVITKALDEQAPKRYQKLKREPRWWKLSLSKKRSMIGRLSKNKKRGPEQSRFLNTLKRDYKREIFEAKEESWKKFCTSSKSATELSRLVKTLTKAPVQTALIKDGQGVQPDTALQSLRNLLNHHFPEHRDSGGDPVSPPPVPGDSDRGIFELLTPNIVKNALGSFAPNKAPGPDEFRPKTLNNLGPKALGLLTEIYRHSLEHAYIPKAFLHMKVVFIPKDKPDRSCPKSYRPITLSSFLLKGLERIVQWYLQETVLKTPLVNQHAYTKNRSCDTALSEAINQIESGLSAKEHVAIVSLDCSGAFDNLTFASSMRALDNFGVSPYIKNWYKQLLSGRQVDSEMFGEKLTVYPTRGSPQGGCCRHLFGTWRWTPSSLNFPPVGRSGRSATLTMYF